MSGNSNENGNGGKNGNGTNANAVSTNGAAASTIAKQKMPTIMLGKNAECISKDGMVCCPCSEGIKYSYFAPTQCYVPMEYYVPVQCCVPVECEIRYGTPFLPGQDSPVGN